MGQTLEKHPEIIVILIPIVWIAILWMISRLGGWAKLASEYHTWNPFEGRTWSLESGQFGWCNYGLCLTVGASHQGLYLAVVFPLRLWHPPILAPWEDISVTDHKSWFGAYIELAFRRAPGVHVRLSRELGDRLRVEVGSRWPGR